MGKRKIIMHVLLEYMYIASKSEKEGRYKEGVTGGRCYDPWEIIEN